MVKTLELKRLMPFILFFAVYTLLFLLWEKTFFYTLPLLIGLLIAILIQPFISFLEKKLRFPHNIASLTAVVLVLTALFVLIGFLCVYTVQEITSFLLKAASGGFSEFSPPVTEFLERAGHFLGQFQADFLKKNQQEMMELLQSSMDLVVSCLHVVLGVITSLPTGITLCIVVAFSTFFLARDLDKWKSLSARFLGNRLVGHLKKAVKNTSGNGRKYLASYLFLYFLTFCETYVILSILNIPYPLLISFITAVADLLPVLGPGIVFTPLAVYQLLIGAYPQAVGLLIGWLITTCIRQIVEPRLISSTTKIHPLAMICAVYFSLVGQSFWILLYVVGFFLLYSTFRETGALPSFGGQEKEKDTPPSS